MCSAGDSEVRTFETSVSSVNEASVTLLNEACIFEDSSEEGERKIRATRMTTSSPVILTRYLRKTVAAI